MAADAGGIWAVIGGKASANFVGPGRVAVRSPAAQQTLQFRSCTSRDVGDVR